MSRFYRQESPTFHCQQCMWLARICNTFLQHLHELRAVSAQILWKTVASQSMCFQKLFETIVRLSPDKNRILLSQVAVGGNHSLALTRTGELFSWGHGGGGRLGVGASQRLGVPYTERSFFPTPMLLQVFSREVVRQVSKTIPRWIRPTILSKTRSYTYGRIRR